KSCKLTASSYACRQRLRFIAKSPKQDRSGEANDSRSVHRVALDLGRRRVPGPPHYCVTLRFKLERRALKCRLSFVRSCCHDGYSRTLSHRKTRRPWGDAERKEWLAQQHRR